MKKILLASTAIVGGALMASSAAHAGNVTAGDNYAVSINGIHRFMIGQYGHDDTTRTRVGRGYGFAAPFTEVHVNAKAQADNGIKYGVTIEIETRGDTGTVADEFYAIVEGDSWGRVELGANDGAADRMNISGANALVATGGYSGGLGLRQFINGFTSTPNSNLSRWDGPITASGDSVKVIYFTPRFAGFQLGASLTPTDTNNGRGALNETGNQNLVELGANYVGKFGDVGLTVAGTYQKAGSSNGATQGNAGLNDLQVWSLGAKVNFAGFTLAAGYEDLDDTGLTRTQTAAGQDAGEIWNVGLGYKTGPWGVSAGYQYGERNISTTAKADVGVIALGAQYAVAPGWTAMAELGLWDVNEGIPGFANDKEVFMIVNQFAF
jgi:outer membrane protein OmpU